jgi:hypothetical protein
LLLQILSGIIKIQLQTKLLDAINVQAVTVAGENLQKGFIPLLFSTLARLQSEPKEVVKWYSDPQAYKASHPELNGQLTDIAAAALQKIDDVCQRAALLTDRLT